MGSPSHRAHDPERPHPLERLSRIEQLRWAGQRRKTRRALDALHLRILRAAAAGQASVHSLLSWDPAWSWDPGRRRDTGCSEESGCSGDSGYSGDSGGDGRRGPVRAVELEVGERRLVGLVSAEAEASLAAAIRSGPVRLVGAGRYGPYWTLNFQAAREVLIVLADRLTLWAGAGDPPGRRRVPALRAGL
jgi:hypothetical protein